MKLQLGVLDVPHPEGETTYIVAEQLEKNYGVYSAFAKTNLPFIASTLAKDAAARLTAQMRGEPTGKPFAGAGDKITDRFKQFIAKAEIESLSIPGVPTQAALAGTSLRTKSGRTISKHKFGTEYKLVYGARRPSFIYSAVWQGSIKCWVEK